MSNQESFHRHGDGRGNRRVLVNGNEIDGVIWCDTKSGVVVYAPYPCKVKRADRDSIYTRRLRGSVTVEPI